jgi:hypothetical protein
MNSTRRDFIVGAGVLPSLFFGAGKGRLRFCPSRQRPAAPAHRW